LYDVLDVIFDYWCHINMLLIDYEKVCCIFSCIRLSLISSK